MYSIPPYWQLLLGGGWRPTDFGGITNVGRMPPYKGGGSGTIPFMEVNGHGRRENP